MEGLDVNQVRGVQHQFIAFISYTQREQLLHSPFIYSFLLYTELFQAPANPSGMSKY